MLMCSCPSGRRLTSSARTSRPSKPCAPWLLRCLRLEWLADRKEALDRIGTLFDIEHPIAGKLPDVRQQIRAQLAKPRLDELAASLDQQLQRIPGRSELAKAIRYARSRWDALTRYIDWRYPTMLSKTKSVP
jgi:Transposase IS66 family